MKKFGLLEHHSLYDVHKHQNIDNIISGYLLSLSYFMFVVIWKKKIMLPGNLLVVATTNMSGIFV